MKRRWLNFPITSMALIGAGVLVRTERKNRQLAKDAKSLPNPCPAASTGVLSTGWVRFISMEKECQRTLSRPFAGIANPPEQGNAKGQYSVGYMYRAKGRRKSLRVMRKRHGGGGKPPNKVTPRLRMVFGALRTSEGKGWHRTSPRLFVGTGSPPNRITPTLNTTLDTCITTATGCRRTESWPTVCSTKPPLKVTRMLSGLLV